MQLKKFLYVQRIYYLCEWNQSTIFVLDRVLLISMALPAILTKAQEKNDTEAEHRAHFFFLKM